MLNNDRFIASKIFEDLVGKLYGKNKAHKSLMK